MILVNSLNQEEDRRVAQGNTAKDLKAKSEKVTLPTESSTPGTYL